MCFNVPGQILSKKKYIYFNVCFIFNGLFSLTANYFVDFAEHRSERVCSHSWFFLHEFDFCSISLIVLLKRKRRDEMLAVVGRSTVVVRNGTPLTENPSNPVWQTCSNNNYSFRMFALFAGANCCSASQIETDGLPSIVWSGAKTVRYTTIRRPKHLHRKWPNGNEVRDSKIHHDVTDRWTLTIGELTFYITPRFCSLSLLSIYTFSHTDRRYCFFLFTTWF